MEYDDFIQKIETTAGYQLPVTTDIYYGLAAGHSIPFGNICKYSACIPIGNKSIVAIFEDADTVIVLRINGTVKKLMFTDPKSSYALEHGQLGDKCLYEKYKSKTSEYAKYKGIGIDKYRELMSSALKSK